ncbi:MAG: hypothetical protein R3C13_11835 [Hyphomonas sp.]
MTDLAAFCREAIAALILRRLIFLMALSVELAPILPREQIWLG